jgi:hypothetical protein
VAPQELFRQFRGRDPEVKFMLENRGLIWDLGMSIVYKNESFVGLL